MEPLLDTAMFTDALTIGTEGIFYIITLVFLVFSLTVAYHWLSYGSNRAQAVLLLVVYMMVSTVFFISMSISLSAL